MAQYGAHIQAMASLTSTASSTMTIFAAAGSGTRWHLTNAEIAVIGAGAGGAARLEETYSAGTSAGVWFNISTGVSGNSNFNFGEKGLTATATNSRLTLGLYTANATVNGVFIGYKR